MDFHLKQWSNDDQKSHPVDADKLSNNSRHPPPLPLPPAKVARFLHEEDAILKSGKSSDHGTIALPLFVAEAASQNSSSSSSFKLTATTIPASCYSYGSSGGYLSAAQWQELELQAFIFRHMAAGATIPPELLHLLKTNLVPNFPSLYLPNYSYYQQQSHPRYWGSTRASAMDAEPGRCRRTDGKKWRCSRDVVPGHKYCVRHVHRGRNRSRKPVEITPPTQVVGSIEGVSSGGSGMFREPWFSLSAPTNSTSQLNQRVLSSSSKSDTKFIPPAATASDGKRSNGQVLRHFFDDFLHGSQETNSNAAAASTRLSISTPSSSSSLDFIKLSTGGSGGADEGRAIDEHQHSQQQPQLMMMGQQMTNWNRMGGPLGEALRSSAGSGSSPTSVLHHHQHRPRSVVSETTYVSA